jgi:hypothetical protein
LCESEGIAVFESLVLMKTRLEKEAAKIMGKKDSNWSAADDLLDRLDELGRVLATCSLSIVAGYDVEELRSVIEAAVVAIDEAKKSVSYRNMSFSPLFSFSFYRDGIRPKRFLPITRE